MDHSPRGTDLLLEDFGQKVDLTRRIREVLVNYPEGTTVLKELIQNADDAGATKVFLCLDRRFHGVNSLLSSELSQFQGPALLAFNDAEFTEDDFVSISRIGDSKKQSQASKTGRFGVGFNSVYHLTDLPSFVSNKYVVLFDPHGSYLPNVSAANPGKRLDFVISSAISLYEDQFKPYCAFGCDMKNPFPGTLFRFPLRNADQAAVSKLSKQVYTADDISCMFAKLYEEAIFSLLFLKSIISIEFYVWEAGVNSPHKVYSCAVKESKEKVARNCRYPQRSYRSVESDWQLESFLVNFLCEATTGCNSERRVETFFIVQGMASASSRLGALAAMASKEYNLHLFPWASVALCLSDDLPEDHFYKEGLVFCSLPLPVRTGLNVHVNGCFEVYSNRRSIWFGSNLDRVGKLRSDWNRLLLEFVVAPAYCELLVGLSKLFGPTMQYYSVWPTGLYEEPWSILVENIYRIAYSAKVLYSNFAGGNWISPAEAFFHDLDFKKSEILGEALVLLGMPVVCLPAFIFETMYKFWSNFNISLVSPVIVRRFLKESMKLGTLNKSYKLVLLEYCLTDLSNEDVDKHVEGLALLPLANDEFGTFTKTMKGTNYFICSELEYSVLGLIPDIMIDRTIPSELLNSLSDIAICSQTNLTFLNEKYFLQLFPRIFPAEWRCENRVALNPGVGTSVPTPTWFTYFWDYIQNQSYDISTFGEWPILPSTSGHLYRTSKTSKFISSEKLSETLQELLVKIGCKILDPAYKINHRDLSLYVSDSDAGGILNSIFDSVSSEGNERWLPFQVLSVPEKIELSRFLLHPKWYLGGFLSDTHIKNAKRLPIYRVYGEQNDENIHFHNLECPTRYLPPVDIPIRFLNGDFVFCSSITEEDILLRYFGIERMPKSAFYKKYVQSRLGELQSDVRDEIMLSILKELPQLCLDDSSIKESLRKLKFIPTVSGSLDCPESLYDPRVDELYALLEDSNCFPGGLFREPSVLDMLLCLGLRTSVSADTIIKSARQVESLMREDQLKASLHGKVLLSYLEVHSDKWFCNNDCQKGVNMMFSRVAASRMRGNNPSRDGIEKFWNDLRMICWCPVLDSAPHATLPWPVVSSMVAPPKIVRPREDIWLVSASSRILDGECRSFALSWSLGWYLPPSGNVIAAQLLELGKNNEIVVDQILRQELAIAMPKLYSLLSNLIGSDEMDIVKVILEGCRWIWVGDGFSTVSEVVLNGQFHLAPYIRVIPVDLAVFRDLFLELGVQECLKPVDYVNILCRMAGKKGCIPLDAQELRAAVSFAQQLAEIQFQSLYVKVYLPDLSSRLITATDLVYNDAPWLLDLEENASGNGSSVSLKRKNNRCNFVHGNISNDIAEKLGVHSLRRLLLAESSDSMNLSLAGVAEAFGQHEALTTRLKHIVEMYADGPGILFELVQNAEDAQASEVVFLLDKTQYGTSSVLSPQMAEWQGPALYCFNDSVFSSQDLYAISRIGQDSKLDKPFAIGRFGLGFNSVYHFTDIPGFVSGENIVIFDPHACHLPGISPSHPGLRIEFVGRKILEQFPDQFMPFLHFGCDLQQPFPGTLFRFPLRNKTAALRSQIKKEKYSPDDVELLFNSFKEVVSESLLFLHNIQRVTIFIKDGPGLQMQLIHRVSRHSDTGLGKELHPLHKMLSFVHGNQQNGMSRDQFMAKLDKISERDLPWSCQKILLLEQSLSGSQLHFWVVSECIGGGRAKSKSLSVINQSFKFVPWASVSCYLHSANLQDLKDNFLDTTVDYYASLVALGEMTAVYYRKTFVGRAFCFLPLPISTGLPIHINAYFELSSNRRDIWFGNDMAGGGKVRSEWNLCLLEDVIPSAYGRLLVCIARELGPCDLYFSFWPTSTGLEPWESMVKQFYAFLSDQKLSVLYTKARGGHWISAKETIFPDFTFPKAIELAEVLSEAGLPVANVSNDIVQRFMVSCPSLHFLTPQFLRCLLIRRHYVFKKKDDIVTTLDYCLSDYGIISSCGSLNGLPLLPLANCKFASFNKRGEGDRVFVVSTEAFDLLFDSVPHLLVDCSIPDSTLKKLTDIANSGLTNLHVLTCYSLVELLPWILPTEWQHSRLVRWTPGDHGHPSFEWMGLLWKYLKASCNDLSIFNMWPILPVKNGFLLQLVENSVVVRNDGWSENLSSLLQKLGCYFLCSDLSLDHPHLRSFVWDATAVGILNAIRASCQLQDMRNLFFNASKAEMRELRSFIFQSRWFSGDQMGSMQIDIIKQLPIFESYKNEVLLALINPLKFLKPVDLLEDLVDDNFIRTDSEREKSILQNYLGIRELSKAEFYENYVFHRIECFLVRPSVLFAIFVDLKQLVEEDDSIKSTLSKVPFVLAADGSWKHPSRLYDPRVPLLQNLLNKEVFFPCDMFSTSEILDILTSFGLRSCLNLSGLIDVARSVSMLHDCGHVDAPQYGRKLLSFLNALGIMLSIPNDQANKHDIDRQSLITDGISHGKYTEMKIDEEKSCEFDQDVEFFISSFVLDKQECEFWSEMKIIPWCPVYVNPLLIGLPWFASDRSVATPETTRPKSLMWQVSSKMRILDGDCHSTYVQEKLGWKDPLDIETLSTQLVALSKSYTQLTLQSKHDFHIDDILQREIPLIYSKLQCYIDKDYFNVLKEALDGISWVWLGDSFVQSNSVAFDSPVIYHPYLYAVPSELSEFRSLLLRLGVRLNFDVMDYLNVLRCLKQDVRGEPLLVEQLSFVQCILEAFADSLADGRLTDTLLNSLFIPSSSGVLMNPSDLVYNDAPWIDVNNTQKCFVHSNIGNDLAKRLGVQSLQGLSSVDEKTARDFSCMDYARISDLFALYGERESLLFDLLELADHLRAKKLHLIFDKRQHPRQSLLQHNLGQFQGSALTVVLEGATLSIEEVRSLHLPPPWKLRGNTLNYGLGLVGSYSICSIMTMATGGFFFIFDPLGLVLSASSGGGPFSKLFTLQENDLTDRFPDQFNPLLMNQGFCSVPSDSTFIRMPLSSKGLEENELGCNRVMQIFNRFMNHASSALLSMKSIFQVSLLTWEEGNLHPLLDYSVSIDPSTSILRNPFSEKRWKKFQLSRIFSTSPDTTKMHVLDVHITQGDRNFVDKWLVVLCLGSGKTRNMALDRRYLSYNLTPFAGVAAHISRNELPISPPASSCILSPLPLSGLISLPVTLLGCFLISHIGGRYLFSRSRGHVLTQQTNANNLLAESWNKELLLCVRDSYVQLVLEFQKIRKDYHTSSIDSNSARSLSYILQAYDDRIYSFWPRSIMNSKSFAHVDSATKETITSKACGDDWASLVEQVIRPFYERLVDMPVWQLYRGDVVKADEGMFLSQLGSENDDSLPASTVCSFIKERYPVFSMPSELVNEIQAIKGKVREITPKMIRGLLKSSVSVLPENVEMYMDVLDYCLSDIYLPDFPASELSGFNNNRLDSVGALQTVRDDMSSSATPFLSPKNIQRSRRDAFQGSSSSGGDAIEVVTYFGKALYDFGRGVVEDIGKATSPLSYVDSASASIIAELKGLPFPTSTKRLVRLGSAELFFGNKDLQLLMHPLADKFVHSLCLEKPFFAKILSIQNMHEFLKLKNFTPQLLSDHLRLLLPESWVNDVLSVNQAPWVPWDNSASSASDGPRPEWIRLFWKIFKDIKGDLSLISEWPLIPAVLDGTILCRVKESKLIFIPPILDPSPVTYNGAGVINSSGSIGKEQNKLYIAAFERMSCRYPWLMSLLFQLNIPVYDMSFLDSELSCYFFPAPGQSLGHAIVSKLVAAKYAGSFPVLLHLSAKDRDRLFTLFALDHKSPSCCSYKREELDMLKELPIYKTVTGSYTMIVANHHCTISPTVFFHPKDEQCLSHSADSNEFLRALGVHELTDQEVFVRFALPDFETKTLAEKEAILLYLYLNWEDLHIDSTVVNGLKETNFVRTANELCADLFKPKDLLDPHDPLLSSVFGGERTKFPGERFIADAWLRILRKIGLRTSSQGDMIIECARKIESLGREAMAHEADLESFETELLIRKREVSLEIWALAESVVVTIFANLSSFFNNDFCETISDIAFVPAEKGLPVIGGKRGGIRILCTYREAILTRDWPLAWCAAPILVKLNAVPPEFSWGAFHLSSPPPFSTVLKHLLVVGRNNGEDTLARWPRSPGMLTVEDASFEILNYLDKNWGARSSSGAR
ncbi:sacsin isoform X2 [Phalaenopsis equestris]|uniref:sacsin isoform X2 n=1 Tax=Phalaenopsis equestris TaxID=78828 RepID=UPI0009E24AAD|nr:sacsin isoform X2 [Phalaenopsis equestris]